MSKGRKQNNLYGNIMLVGHEGDCLGRISEKRARFYLKKDLAFNWTNQVITSKESDDTKFLKLKFTENGLGKNGQKFFMAKRENQCVVCGEKESLHKTYIVPKEFRKYMPKSYRLHNDYDLMLMCTKHHNIFSQLLQKQKNDFLKKISINYNDFYEEKLPSKLEQVKKAATAFLIDSVPENIKRQKLQFIDSILQTNLYNNYINMFSYVELQIKLQTLSNLPSLYKSRDHFDLLKQYFRGSNPRFFNKFIMSWRIFFTMSMLPKFIPEYWTPHDNLIG